MRISECIKKANRPFLSLEFFPPSDEKQLPQFEQNLSKLEKLEPLFVSVTYGAGGARQHNTLALTADLAKRGLIVMAHLTCVGASKDSIASFLKELREANVQNILALRGDAPKDKVWDWQSGDFKHAIDLVRFTRKIEANMDIGVAAYPTPHPESISFADDRRHTAEKLRSGATFAITQLFFDVREYEELTRTLHDHGNCSPVIPGILPIQSFDSLRRILSLCGTNIPGKLYLDLEKANDAGGIEAVREVGLKFAINQIRTLIDMGAPGIHLYTLNRAELCLQLADEVGFKKCKIG